MPPRSQRGLLWLSLAFVPATMLMFQAFSGLAVLLPPEDYRTMVLVNAVVLVAAQPLLDPVVQRVGVTAVVAGGIGAMAVGMAAQASQRVVDDVLWTVVWTCGEIIVVILPGALISAAAPVADAARYVGWFQVIQGLAAVLGLVAGPVVAARGPAAFAALCTGLGVAGVAGVPLTRGLARQSWQQPLGCPCGAFFCACGGQDTGCAAPTVVVTHRMAHEAHE